MSETMENAALNSGEIADRTPAAKAEETKADKFIRLGMMSVRSIITMGTERYIPLLTEKKRRNILHRLKRKYRKRKLPSGVMWRLPRRPFMKMQNRH